jgi:O-antigen ligase
MRVELNNTAFQKFLEFPVLGTGLGSIVKYRYLNIGDTWSLDTSHLQILWKMGIAGGVIYFALLIVIFRRLLFVFRRTGSVFFKCLSCAAFAGFSGLIFLSFFSASLTKYNLNLVWAMILASVEYEAVRLGDNPRGDR